MNPLTIPGGCPPIKRCSTCTHYEWDDAQQVGECSNFTEEEMDAYDKDASVTHETFPHESCEKWKKRD